MYSSYYVRYLLAGGCIRRHGTPAGQAKLDKRQYLSQQGPATNSRNTTSTVGRASGQGRSRTTSEEGKSPRREDTKLWNRDSAVPGKPSGALRLLLPHNLLLQVGEGLLDLQGNLWINSSSAEGSSAALPHRQAPATG